MIQKILALVLALASCAVNGQSFTETRTNQLTVTGPTTGTKTSTGYSPISTSQTWNAAGVTFPGVTFRFTDTASAAASNAFQIFGGALGATSLIKVDKNGNLSGATLSGATSIGSPLFSSTANASAGYRFGAANDANISRLNAASLAIGNGTAGNTSGSITAQGAAVFGPTQTKGATAGAGANSLNVMNSTPVVTFDVRDDGALFAPLLPTSSAATTGTLCWTTGTGAIDVDTTTTCLLSSKKYKQAERPLSSGLPEVLALRPISYTLRDDYNPTHLGEQIGFFAEDVAAVDPRLVSFDTQDGSPHAVRYQQLTALLTRAIQQQQAKIEMLTARLNALEKSGLVRTTYH